ncbi:MAG: NAD(P)-dependent oxidoreductase, partial [Longicatena sp.]
MKIKLFNKIANIGIERFDENYEFSEDFENYDAVLVRSAKLHDVEFPKDLKCIARAGAGVNNIPLDTCSEQGIVVFNTPGANANAVKELVIAALLMSSRKITKGIEWVKTLEEDEISKVIEKGKGNYVGPEIAGKKLGVIGLGAIGVQVANAAAALDMDVYGFDPF